MIIVPNERREFVQYKKRKKVRIHTLTHTYTNTYTQIDFYIYPPLTNKLFLFLLPLYLSILCLPFSLLFSFLLFLSQSEAGAHVFFKVVWERGTGEVGQLNVRTEFSHDIQNNSFCRKNKYFDSRKYFFFLSCQKRAIKRTNDKHLINNWLFWNKKVLQVK